ncbi:stress responsive A/B barrel domain-containing protein [Aspergillus caelatus]|uniref:Stress responsive A/B barrel domain-containing protein n=2 Tax=Aspergillus subgen. Circumdati TaxID=2720871 RepID=A0A5N7AAP1_9EURO|nr:stress responsive A/B barrel domain-containing protein [Aspergillus caelatus]KAE8365650.1 stress responsive A/B barrel domain-containing protein [Aspergillus caelatus]KAE8417862.1 stress responsive A/B barrel domain-containing protein [Aspergillus pseudocaelatus]
MPFLHLVLFKFKPEIGITTQQEILREFLSLPQKCKDSSHNPYITSIRGGVECGAGSSSGYTHIFIVEFNSMQEREYYKGSDPVHLHFASRIMRMLAFIRILVFEECNFLYHT